MRVATSGCGAGSGGSSVSTIRLPRRRDEIASLVTMRRTYAPGFSSRDIRSQSRNARSKTDCTTSCAVAGSAVMSVATRSSMRPDPETNCVNGIARSSVRAALSEVITIIQRPVDVPALSRVVDHRLCAAAACLLRDPDKREKVPLAD